MTESPPGPGPGKDRIAHVESPTERRNPATTGIDRMCTADILATVNAEDRSVPEAVGRALPELTRAVDTATGALRAGGRVHYVGAGTSGRLAVLDAAELAPTYNIPSDWFVTHHAGGSDALREAVENAEDDEEAAAADLRGSVADGDFVLGLTASGWTPYVLAALRTAKHRGAATALVTGNPEAPVPDEVDIRITVDTGPEVIAGSTRMKAGTAQKLVLTSFSTATMIKMGRTYSNLMVSVHATNAKLRGRTVRVLREATGLSAQSCAQALARAGGDLKVALVHLLSGAETAAAAAALDRAGGHVREALTSVGPATP